MVALPRFSVEGNLQEVPGYNLEGDLVEVPVPQSTQIRFTHNIRGPIIWDGKVEFVAPLTVTVNDDGTIASVDSPVLLLANDDGLSVSNIQWKASIQREGYPSIEWWFDAPVDGETVDLATVARVIPTAVHQLVEGPQGPAGDPTTIDGGSPSSDGDTLDANSDPGDYARFQVRRGTTVQWAATTDPLRAGEPAFDLTTSRLKVGDGSTLFSALDAYATIADVNEVLAGAGSIGFELTEDGSTGLFDIVAGGNATLTEDGSTGLFVIG